VTATTCPDRPPIEFGWFLPTAGDTTAYGVPGEQVPSSPELFERVVQAAEAAGFEYLLIPVQTACWEAWVTGAFLAGRSSGIRMLVAARPGYINPVLLAKMVTTFDQLSGGRICVNLIAGQSEQESRAEGITLDKQDRYSLMEEEVTILKRLWTERGALTHHGRHHHLEGAQIRPAPWQRPHPRFYLGGGSRDAWEVSARHADVHLFWGDTYERIGANMAEIRAMAESHGRGHAIGFGMRLQIVCRETEAEAWAAAEHLVEHVSEATTRFVREHFGTSEANRRVQELAMTMGDLIEPNLWTGITRTRPGAGIAVVGDPRQCADVLQRYIDLGCRSFCLSGYLHDAEAERFGRLVRPLLEARNPGRLAPIPGAR
jgi:alkanesulfonate monooxygenase